ncbi:MAG: carboxypeptidase-like regulatory domain-containing protein, partial [Bacteroidota bacterium]
MTRIFFLFTSLHSSVALFGQNNSVLEGQVLFSNEPLAYAHIYVEGTIFGTVTNELGYFVLNLPDAKDITIVISEIGFKTRKLDLIDFPKDGIIELKQDTYRLDEVVINSSKLMMNDPFG